MTMKTSKAITALFANPFVCLLAMVICVALVTLIIDDFQTDEPIDITPWGTLWRQSIEPGYVEPNIEIESNAPDGTIYLMAAEGGIEIKDCEFAEPNEPLSDFTCICGNQIYLAGYYSSHRDELVTCAGCGRLWKITDSSLEIVEPKIVQGVVESNLEIRTTGKVEDVGTLHQEPKEPNSLVLTETLIRDSYSPDFNDYTTTGSCVVVSLDDLKPGSMDIDGAVIERGGDNRLKCNVSKSELWRRIYNVLKGPRSTDDVKIEFVETNEPNAGWGDDITIVNLKDLRCAEPNEVKQ
jgi:hypothetical protein